MAALNAEGGAQVIFVDEVKAHFAGHEPDGRVCCRNDDRWIHEFDTFTPMEWYHYNPTGHAELAGLLSRGPRSSSARDIVAGGAVDIAFVIDTTGSMGGSIDSVKAAAVSLVNDVSARTSAARFALVDYRDFPERTGDRGTTPPKLDLDFTSTRPRSTQRSRASASATAATGRRRCSPASTARSISPGGPASRSWRSCSLTRRRSRPSRTPA